MKGRGKKAKGGVSERLGKAEVMTEKRRRERDAVEELIRGRGRR